MGESTVIGVDLGGTNVGVARIVGKKITEDLLHPVSAEETEKTVLREIVHAVDSVYDESVDAIGVGVPGLVDVGNGVLFDFQNIPAFKHTPLKKHLQDRFQVPVYLNNDANCFALGHKHFGHGVDVDNMIGVIIGTGLGTGMVLNGQLYSGINCGAGEFGHIPYLDGELEDYCSGNYFKKIVGLSGEQVYEDACGGDGDAVDLFAQYAKHLAQACAIMIYSVDPELVVFGGSVAKSFEFFIEPLKSSLAEKFIYKRSLEKVRFAASDQNKMALLGAAALCFENPS